MKQEKTMRKESNSNVPVVRNYKDSIFRMIFREKQASLNLYNALNQTDYHDLDALEINTLENAIYLGRRNDVSFYNGLEEQPEIQRLKLSDVYEDASWPRSENDCTLELDVLMININEGNHRELMEKCKELNEYTIYVERVRR